MALSNLPPFYNMRYTDSNGNLLPEALNYNDQMFQTLDQMVNQVNNGWQLPLKSTTQITVYRDDDTVPVGTIWFNTSIGKIQVKTALGSPGTIETVTSLP
ncbi:hypothetical protein YTPLAS21_19100 [Candidatus Nitrosocosmicus sp.]|nr:hypothetical protein YTPLAS21_19100 [Candidatus Nitrosocosmicus sp.]